MKSHLLILGLMSLSILLTAVKPALAASVTVEPLICEESGVANSESGDEGDMIIFGKYTIHFDQSKNPIAVDVERAATSPMPELKFRLSLDNAKISKKTIGHKDDNWGIESHERITALGNDGSKVILNLEDHKYAGNFMGSAVEIKFAGHRLSTSEIEHNVICMTPSQKADWEKEVNGALE